MLRFLSRSHYAILFFAIVGATLCVAQSVTARFSGRVSDSDGGVIPGATVQVINQETFARREAKTDASGNYVVASLPAGRYQVVVQAEGFARKATDVITLVAGQAFVFNVQMSIGLQTEVEVKAGAGVTTVETDTASISTTIGEREVTGYALNGRNFSQLITMAPGVSNQTGQDEAKVGVAGSGKFSVNGGRVEYNTFQVDGSDVLNTSINASRGQGEPLMVYPSIDAIQEMKVLTADYSALYGKSASGSVLVTTKSGTDQFHGNVYGFLRNEMFNARNYFDQPDAVPLGYTGRLRYRTPLYRRLDFGVTIGGPLFIPHIYNQAKNKTYFFFSEEIRREKTPTDYNQAVPTARQRTGDFSDVCPQKLPGSGDTFDTNTYPDCPQGGSASTTSQPYIGRSVSVNPISAAILNSGLIPAPNSSTGCNSTNASPLPHCYVASVSPPTHWREELFRIDHNLTANQRLSFRYIHDSWDTVTLAPQWGVVQNSFPTVENQLTGPGLNMVFSVASTLPHGFTNLFSASYEVEHISLVPQPGVGLSSLQRPAILDNPASTGGAPVAGSTTCAAFTAPSGSTPSQLTQCPMGYIFANGFGGSKLPGQAPAGLLPGLAFQGNNGAYGGHGFAADTGYAPWTQSNPTFDLRDDVSKVIGKHSLQFGFQGTFVQQNELSAVSGANSGDLQGLLTFSNQQSINTTGNAFADFIAGPGFFQGNPPSTGFVSAGAIKSFTQDSGQGRYYNRYKIAEFYVEDDWRLTPGLTINAGFRGSLFGVWYNPKNAAYNWRQEAFSQSLGHSIYVDPINGYLAQKGTGAPVLPYNAASPSPIITNGLVQCGGGGVPNSCMSNSLFHPAPRIGVAWDPLGNGKTAIRGGYGLYWEHGTGYEANVGSLIGSAPLVLSETQSNIKGYGAIGFSCQGGVAQCPGVSTSGGATFPLNVTAIPTRATYPYTQQWSLSVQREIRKAMVAQIAYVGTKGTHLTAVRDLNQLDALGNGYNPFGAGEPITASVCLSGASGTPFMVSGINTPGAGNGITVPSSAGIGPNDPGYTNMLVACTGNPGFITNRLGVSADSVRRYAGFSNVISVENIANSAYSALQATVRETTGPLTIGAAYTWSHSLDDSSDRSSANFANSLDIRSSRGSSDFDQRHLLNVNYIYELPLLKMLGGFNHLVGSGGDPAEEGSAPSKAQVAWQPGAALKTVLGGWQLSGITTYQTGTPFSVINGGGSNGTGASDNAGVGNGIGIGSYADKVSDAHVGKPYIAPNSNNVGPLLLNPGAYVAPRGLTFGNSGRNSLNNPSRINFNMSLYKHFKPFKERLDVEFRTEAFNVFNHTQFRITDPSHPGNIGNNVINCYGTQAELYSAGGSGCLAGNSFLHPVDAHDPRIMQFGLKGSF